MNQQESTAVEAYTFSHGTLYKGDAFSILHQLPDNSVHCCVTSPPYWNLRDYQVSGQLGLESSFYTYVERLVSIMGQVKRVLRDDGTLWLNLGDSYAHDAKWGGQTGGLHVKALHGQRIGRRKTSSGLPAKSLIGIPWRVAFALQADGWILRQDIIWHKPNPMPESVTDRCTKSHEYIFLLSKSSDYSYDHEAIKEPVASILNPDLRPPHDNTLSFARHVNEADRPGQTRKQYRPDRMSRSGNKERKPATERGCPKGNGKNLCGSVPWEGSMRNKRSVWTVTAKPFKGAHFATFPPELIEPCIMAGCPMGGTVLDPFFGSGTVGEVARAYRRKWIGIELNPEYCEIAVRRVEGRGIPRAGGNAPMPLLDMLGEGVA